LETKLLNLRGNGFKTFYGKNGLKNDVALPLKNQVFCINRAFTGKVSWEAGSSRRQIVAACCFCSDVDAPASTDENHSLKP
jgi:hypothetical protein